MTVTAASPWHLDIPDECTWLTVSQHSGGKGTTALIFTADINDQRLDRAVSIQCSADDGSFVEAISISQVHPYLRISKVGAPDWTPSDTLRFEWNQYEYSPHNNHQESIRIESNISWRVVPETGPASRLLDTLRTNGNVFLGVSVLEGAGDAVLDILPHTQNTDTVFNRLTFRIIPVIKTQSDDYIDIREMSKNGEKAVDGYILNARQKNLIFLLDSSSKDKQYSLSELNETFSCTITSEEAWDIASESENIDWLRLSTQSATAGNTSLTISADQANPKRENRNALICLKTKSGALRSIRVVQRPYVFSADSDSFSFNNNDKSTRIVKVKTTGDIQLSNVPDWLSYSISSYNNVDSTFAISFSLAPSIGQNLAFETVYTSGLSIGNSNNSLICPLQVSQAPFVFKLDIPDELKSTLPTDDVSPYSICLTSSGQWEATIDGSWVSLCNAKQQAASSGEAGENILTIQAKSANEDKMNPRSATILFYSIAHSDRGVSYDPIKLIFSQGKFIFEVTDTDGQSYFSSLSNIPAYKQPFDDYSITINSSVPWSLTSPAWITSWPDSGEPGVTKISLVPFYNESLDADREGIITLKPIIGEPKNIAVRQNAFVFDVSQEEFIFQEPLGASIQKAHINCSSGWKVVSNNSWIECTPMESTIGGNNADLDISVTDNTTTDRRRGSIRVISEIGEHAQDIAIIQYPYVFSVETSELLFDATGAAQATIPVFCSGTFSYSSGSDNWLTVTQSNDGLSVSVTDNPYMEDRTTSIVVYSKNNTSLMKTIPIRQKAFVFTADAEQLHYKAISSTSQTITISCSSGWDITSHEDWISCSPEHLETGAFDQSMTISVKDNNTLEERHGTILLKSRIGGHEKAISVLQNPYIFTVDTDEIQFDAENAESVFVHVVCSGTYTWETSDPDWVKVEQSENGLSLSVENNTSAETRVSYLDIISSGGHRKRITIHQNAS